MSFYLPVMEEKILPNMCRACMTGDGDFQSVFMFVESTGLNIHLAEMVMAYSSVQIMQGDGLPEQICTECAKKVSEFYLFKLKCEETDKNLRSIFAKSPYNVISDQITDVIIKSEIDEEDFKVTPYLITNAKVESDDFRENEDNEFVDILPKTEIIEIEEKISFECDICYKRFPRNDFLINHKKLHIYKVNEAFQSNETMKDRPQIIEYVDLKSEFDSKCYETEESGTGHLAVQKSDDLTCKVCNEQFRSASCLTSHMEAHAADKLYNCNLNNEGFGQANQLSQHVNDHSRIKPHVCNTCSKGFNNISNLKYHMRVHNREKHLGNLKQHKVRHNGVKAHLCNICGRSFRSKGGLSAHVKKHTDPLPFVCSECNCKAFTTLDSLMKHKKMHSVEKPYECDVCEMKFSRSGDFARHKRTHTGEKRFVCNICSSGFASRGGLSTHLNKHTGVRPFVCSECNKAFTDSNSLVKHKRIHSGEKPYECDVCNIKFSQSGILARHKRSHTSERPYLCDTCGQAFKLRNTLTTHQKIHTKSSPTENILSPTVLN